jgi:flagella basal body P-ring formation protein FlgA
MRFVPRPFLALALSIVLGIPAHAALADVVMKGEVQIGRPIVRLSDVFSGLPDGVDCDIASAPQPGRSITYNLNTLSYLAKQYHLDWKPVSATDHMIITTASTHIAADDISKVIVEKLKDQDVKGIIDVSFDNHTMEVNLPADRSSNFTLNNFEYDALDKRFRADFVADGDSGPITFPIIGRITIKHSVPVLSRRLEGGTIIGASDIDWIEVPDERLTNGVVANADQLIGYELRRDTEGGQLLHDHDVTQPRLVVRGTMVTMKIETPLMIVTAQGRALQDGAMGDVVRINNVDSNRMIEGTVSGPGLVTIKGPQKFAAAP